MVDGKTFSDYRILARKYRPKNFSEIIGQDITVQVLRNAISLGKYPQGIIFTGIRGVGKTTLARIIAKCLNYVGSDGSGIPTADPKDDCPNERLRRAVQPRDVQAKVVCPHEGKRGWLSKTWLSKH